MIYILCYICTEYNQKVHYEMFSEGKSLAFCLCTASHFHP